MAILFRRSNGIYYHVTYFHGRRIWRSTGKRRRVDAEKTIRTFDHEREQKKAPELTLSQFATQFFPYAETNLASATVEIYRAAIKNFMRHIGDKNLKAYTPFDVEKFKTLRAKEVSPVMTNIQFRSVKALFQVGVKWNLLDKNPFTGVKNIKIPPQRPAFLTKVEFNQLVESIPAPWFRNLVAFAVATMMRAGEIVNLTWDSVDLGRRIILVENRNGFRVKTTQPRSIPMNDWVFRFLAAKENNSGYVFRFPDGRRTNVHYVSKKFKEYSKDAGLSDKIHFHSLRHTGASWLVQDGVSIYAVQRLLGHSNIQVTMGYSHLCSGELHSVINRILIATN